MSVPNRSRLPSGKWGSPIEALRKRVIFLANNFAATDRKFDYLESRTGIAASKWQDVFLGISPPNTEMLLAMALHRRDKIEWMLTGHVSRLIKQKRPHTEIWADFIVTSSSSES